MRPALPLPLLLLLALPSAAEAMPRFAVQQGAACSLCHVNPTGGGARSAYGRVFARQVLSMALLAPEDGLPLVDPSIGDWGAFGLDARAAVIYARPRDTQTDPGESHGFFLMQGDVYLNAHLGPHAGVYLDQGTHGSQEMFVWAGVSPVVIKAGKFMPAHGWRLPDHTSFTRESIGFGPRAKDTGVSVVLDHPFGTVEAGVFNGAGPDAPLDLDRKRAYAARAEGRLRTSWVNLHAGASAYWNRTEAGEALRYGLFGGVSAGRFTYLAELDKADDEQGGARVEGYAAYHELSVVALRGLQAALTYDFRDPDIDVRRDGLHRAGVSAGFFPWPGIELEAAVRDSIGYVDNPRAGQLEIVVVLHGYL
jgi:hypothetical protein